MIEVRLVRAWFARIVRICSVSCCGLRTAGRADVNARYTGALVDLFDRQQTGGGGNVRYKAAAVVVVKARNA